MKECPNQKKNLEKCNCTYDSCDRKASAASVSTIIGPWGNCRLAISRPKWSGLMTAALPALCVCAKKGGEPWP